jgi:hypothetical protein
VLSAVVLVVLVVTMVLVVVTGAVSVRVEPTTDVDVDPAAIVPIIGSEVEAHALTNAPQATSTPAPRHHRRVGRTISSMPLADSLPCRQW